MHGASILGIPELGGNRRAMLSLPGERGREVLLGHEDKELSEPEHCNGQDTNLTGSLHCASAEAGDR